MTPLKMYRLGLRAEKQIKSSVYGKSTYIDVAKKNRVAKDLVFKARLFAQICREEDAKVLRMLSQSHISVLTTLGNRKDLMRIGRKAVRKRWSVRKLRSIVREHRGLRPYGGRKPAKKELNEAVEIVRETAQALVNHITYLEENHGSKLAGKVLPTLQSTIRQSSHLQKALLRI